MDYHNEVARAVAAHVDDLRGDLRQAKDAFARCTAERTRIETEITALEWLLHLADDRVSTSETPSHTLHEAMAAVLRRAPEMMMRAGDLAAEINRRGLYRMRGWTPR